MTHQNKILLLNYEILGQVLGYTNIIFFFYPVMFLFSPENSFCFTSALLILVLRPINVCKFVSSFLIPVKIC